MIIPVQNHRESSSSWLIKGNKKKGKEDKTIAAILADRICGGMGVAFAPGGSL